MRGSSLMLQQVSLDLWPIVQWLFNYSQKDKDGEEMGELEAVPPLTEGQVGRNVLDPLVTTGEIHLMTAMEIA